MARRWGWLIWLVAVGAYADQALRVNDDCIALIKASEGVRLEAYVGPAGHWLIGYGHAAGVTEGQRISAREAEQLLRDDLRSLERDVLAMVETNLNQGQFSALVCLAYNIGIGNFRRSTVLKKVNAGSWGEAADAFAMWNKVNGESNAHLTKRRAKERAMFVGQ
ncbi:MAG: lysozyme [Pseudomonadota bacterium]